MKRLDYSIHAARSALTVIVLVGVPVAVGHLLGGNAGWIAGFVLGWILVAVRVAWLHWSRRRGDGWIRMGREHGLRSLYSERSKPIPLPGFEERKNVLGGTFDSFDVQVGDRLERYLDYRSRASMGTLESNRAEVTDPVPVETFFAVWIPGLDEPCFAVGKRRGWIGGEPAPQPSGPAATVLQSWIRQHPGWRLEGWGNCIVGYRPFRVATLSEMPQVIGVARSLAEALGKSMGVGVTRRPGESGPDGSEECPAD